MTPDPITQRLGISESELIDQLRLIAAGLDRIDAALNRAEAGVVEVRGEVAVIRDRVTLLEADRA